MLGAIAITAIIRHGIANCEERAYAVVQWTVKATVSPIMKVRRRGRRGDTRRQEVCRKLNLEKVPVTGALKLDVPHAACMAANCGVV